MTAGSSRWPQATVDRIARLRILAEGLPGTVVAERTFDAPFEQVWGRVADLENAVPRFDRDVAALRVAGRRGERLDIRARPPWLPVALRFDVDLTEGWCWMVTRPHAYVVGMAAEPTADGRTRFAHLEGLAFGAPRRLAPLVRPVLALSRARHRRHIGHDLAGIAALVVDN
jgi:hypothetical protein